MVPVADEQALKKVFDDLRAESLPASAQVPGGVATVAVSGHHRIQTVKLDFEGLDPDFGQPDRGGLYQCRGRVGGAPRGGDDGVG
jgi:hypothetical protein